MPQAYTIQKQDLYGKAYAPYNTGFVARKASSQTLSGGSDNIIQFSTVDYNQMGYNANNGYNSSNHRFTAPSRGLYHFSACFMGNIADTGYIRTGIKKNNGTHFGLTYATFTNGAYESIVTTAAVYLEQNDYVEVVSYITTSSFVLDNTGSFTGFLVG
jgi:hypothetical protein